MNVLIVGGGVAGLSAGIHALLRGHSVTILEQHKIAGGNLTGWTRLGCHIDNCIHWLTGTNKHSEEYEIWNQTGVLGDKVEIIKQDLLFTYKIDNKSLSLYRNIDDTIDEMLKISPDDKKEIIKFGKVVKKSMYISSLGGKHHNEKLNFFTILKIGPSIIKFHRMTCGEYGKRFKHPLLQGFFSCLTGPDFSMMAFVLTAANFCSGNADLPRGGSLPAAQRMLSRFKALGGKFLSGIKVTKFNTRRNLILSVEGDNGITYKADKYISTINPKMLFGKMINIGMPKKLSKIYQDNSHKRFSFLHAAFVVPKDALSFHGTVIFDASELHSDYCCGSKIIAKEFSYEDKYAPDGCAVVQTMSYIYEDECKKWIQSYDSPELYNRMKQQLAVDFASALENQFPTLKGKLQLLDVWTPASYVKYVGSEIGSFMAFSMPAKKIPKIISSKTKKIKNLILATQWQMAPGGLPIAAKMGKKAAAMC